MTAIARIDGIGGSERVRCPNCDTGNEPTRKFCRECGTALSLPCPACGTANPPADKFCGECGAALAVAGPAGAPPLSAAPPARPEAAAERRLVSVLFADLVGFTTLSERRDPEDVRELLTRYFDTARRLVERYGGVIEKFIGDAVMAVWGTRRPRRTTPSGPSEPPLSWSTPSASSGAGSARTTWPPGPGC
jgi:hypothetical protein